MIQEHKEYTHTLVATLGGQPQLVTLTLDLLLQRGIPISEVVVVHPASSPSIQDSLTRLHAEFVGNCYMFEGSNRTISLHQKVLSHYGAIIDDIIDEATAIGTLDTIGELIRGLKQQQHIIHFSISGGRSLMAFFSFSAALLYFDISDELLYLYVPESLKESVAMHIPLGSGQHLIEVPFARAAQPIFSTFRNTPSITAQKQIETYNEKEVETGNKDYDVFLCYTHKDKQEVKRIGEQLKERGIVPWLDEWELQPGLPWQQALEKQIEKIKAVAAFVSTSGASPWQDLAMRDILRRFVDQKSPVIPVILPDTRFIPSLPPFLGNMIWVDFRRQDPDPFERLTWGITGEKPI